MKYKTCRLDYVEPHDLYNDYPYRYTIDMESKHYISVTDLINVLNQLESAAAYSEQHVSHFDNIPRGEKE